MSPIDRLLAALRGHGYEPKRAGQAWTCRCPAHDDRKPSLAIGLGQDGRVLVHCHAGCPTASVVACLGMGFRDLMPDAAWQGRPLTQPRRRPGTRGSVSAGPRKKVQHAGFALARDAVAQLERRYGRRTSAWSYCDSSGEAVGLVVRWDRPAGKLIRPVSRHGSHWFVGAMPTPRPLYRLPALGSAQRVFVTEGEKAADAAWSIGLVATTSAHGSRSARKTDWTPLAGRECVLLPDNDAAGRDYVDEVAAILARLSPPPLIKVLALPHLPPGGDMADYVAARRVGR